MYAEFSPDGRWLAYSSNETGRDEIYVRAYPGAGAKYKVSADGGSAPAWAPNGRELFYMVPGPDQMIKMMTREVTLGATPTLGVPRVLFEGQYSNSFPSRGYDVTPNGRRFLMVRIQDQAPPPPLIEMILVQDWSEELKRLVPTK